MARNQGSRLWLRVVLLVLVSAAATFGVFYAYLAVMQLDVSSEELILLYTVVFPALAGGIAMLFTVLGTPFYLSWIPYPLLYGALAYFAEIGDGFAYLYPDPTASRWNGWILPAAIVGALLGLLLYKLFKLDAPEADVPLGAQPIQGGSAYAAGAGGVGAAGVGVGGAGTDGTGYGAGVSGTAGGGYGAGAAGYGAAQSPGAYAPLPNATQAGQGAQAMPGAQAGPGAQATGYGQSTTAGGYAQPTATGGYGQSAGGYGQNPTAGYPYGQPGAAQPGGMPGGAQPMSMQPGAAQSGGMQPGATQSAAMGAQAQATTYVPTYHPAQGQPVPGGSGQATVGYAANPQPGIGYSSSYANAAQAQRGKALGQNPQGGQTVPGMQQGQAVPGMQQGQVMGQMNAGKPAGAGIAPQPAGPGSQANSAYAVQPQVGAVRMQSGAGMQGAQPGQAGPMGNMAGQARGAQGQAGPYGQAGQAGQPGQAGPYGQVNPAGQTGQAVYGQPPYTYAPQGQQAGMTGSAYPQPGQTMQPGQAQPGQMQPGQVQPGPMQPGQGMQPGQAQPGQPGQPAPGYWQPPRQ